MQDEQIAELLLTQVQINIKKIEKQTERKISVNSITNIVPSSTLNNSERTSIEFDHIQQSLISSPESLF